MTLPTVHTTRVTYPRHAFTYPLHTCLVPTWVGHTYLILLHDLTYPLRDYTYPLHGCRPLHVDPYRLRHPGTTGLVWHYTYETTPWGTAGLVRSSGYETGRWREEARGQRQGCEGAMCSVDVMWY
eukprot:86838-Rhodomonas_salina.2